MIDENKLKEQMFALVEQIGDERLHIDAVVHLIDDAPTVDAVPVVRCKDCIRYRPDGNVWGRCTVAANPMRKKDFCSYGVRKDGGDETD